jgi:hypothetical protein
VAIEPPETEPCETETLPPTEPAGGKAGMDRKNAAPKEVRIRLREPERGSGSDDGVLRPGAGEHGACPIRECQVTTTHPLDECERFKSLSVPQREKAIREWNRCECCLTDCRDKKTGSRCYRRHHLLRLVPQAEASQAGGQRRQQQRPRRRAAKGDQTTPQGKPNQDDAGHGQGRAIMPQRQTDRWSFPVFSKDREMVWLRATRSQHASATRITHQAAVRLGLAQSVTEAYQIQLRLSSEPRFVLRAEGVETLIADRFIPEFHLVA